MTAQQQYNYVKYPNMRFLVLRGLAGASRPVARVLEERYWVQLPRWAKEKLKQQVQKLKRDGFTIQDWVEECHKENRHRAASKKEKESVLLGM